TGRAGGPGTGARRETPLTRGKEVAGGQARWNWGGGAQDVHGGDHPAHTAAGQ
ncbi:PSMC3 isoform 13, partial [Pan troglodytes]